MRRIALACLAATLAVPLLSQTARAGGGPSWVVSDETPMVGQTLHAGFTTWAGSEARKLAAEPVTVYLVPTRVSGIDPPKIPAAATSVGPATLSAQGKNIRVDVTFSVPDVPTGYYAIEACTNPCRDTGISAAWSTITVVHTAKELALIKQSQRADQALRREHRETRAAEKRFEEYKLAHPAQPVTPPTRPIVTPLVQATSKEATPSRFLPGAALGLLVGLAIGLVGSLILRRRHRPGSLAPIAASVGDASVTGDAPRRKGTTGATPVH